MSVKLIRDPDVLRLYVHEHTRPIIMQVSASWCKPCQSILPFFKELALKNKSVTFLYVDVDVCDDAETILRVSNLPTFIGYKKHQRVGKVEGDDREGLYKLVQKLVKR